MITWPDIKLPPINLYNLPILTSKGNMNKSEYKDKQALADITVFNKYARFDHTLNRRENWEEIVTRNMEMHITKYPHMEQSIRDMYKSHVYTKKVLPSMRSLQFGGRPILMAENRIFNCAYAPAESVKFFSELMFLLLGGTGMGYSVQNRHISKLPKVKTPESDMEYKFQVQDSIVGWADAVKVVCKAFFTAGTLPIFDYRDIREKGSDLVTTGGQAPGPEPLKICIEQLITILRGAVGRKLTSLEVHDMACIIADAVLAGGIRRAAMISLFDRDDEAMLTSKSGEWYVDHAYRARANNSAVLPRGEVSEAEFRALMKRVEESGCGEPGVYWTNNKDWGTNPCCEIALRPYQMCNLTEINAGAIYSQKDYNKAAEAASFIGTLQAGYTDFHYLNPKWRIACEKDALLGVSMTGIASGTVEKLDMEWAAEIVIETNADIAKRININPAARTTCVKPAGTTSLVLGTASGIHAWHADYYIRRMRAGKDEALAQYMMIAAPGLVEQDVNVPHQVVLSFPQKAPKGATVRTEPMLSLLERVKNVSVNWVANGHSDGINQHNVSCTISVKDTEWKEITDWMWDNRAHYNGISVLPYFGAAAYPQLPFEDITEEKYLEMLPMLEGIDIGQVYEDNGRSVDLKAELACSGGSCELV
jgi:ribonucleoside-triphosphate reductase